MRFLACQLALTGECLCSFLLSAALQKPPPTSCTWIPPPSPLSIDLLYTRELLYSHVTLPCFLMLSPVPSTRLKVQDQGNVPLSPHHLPASVAPCTMPGRDLSTQIQLLDLTGSLQKSSFKTTMRQVDSSPTICTSPRKEASYTLEQRRISSSINLLDIVEWGSWFPGL